MQVSISLVRVSVLRQRGKSKVAVPFAMFCHWWHRLSRTESERQTESTMVTHLRCAAAAGVDQPIPQRPHVRRALASQVARVRVLADALHMEHVAAHLQAGV